MSSKINGLELWTKMLLGNEISHEISQSVISHEGSQ